MLRQLWNSLILVGVLILLVILWALSLRAVYRDVHRRNFPLLEQLFWLAIALSLPLVGALVYLAARLSQPLVLPSLHDPSTPQHPPPGRLPGWPGQNGKPARPSREVQPSVRFQMMGGDVSDLPSHRSPDDLYGGTTRPSSLARHGESDATLPPEAPLPALSPFLRRPTAVQVGYRVVVMEGPEAGKVFHLDRLPALIGRGAQTQVRIETDPAISRQHAELYEMEGTLRIRDLNSMHGTSVNGLSVMDHEVNPGDQVGVGYTILVIHKESGEGK